MTRILVVVWDDQPKPIDDRWGHGFEGMNLEDYFPMAVHCQTVVVPPGEEFSGWENYHITQPPPKKKRKPGPKPHPEFPKFEKHVIDRIGKSMGGAALADVDLDGDLDWFAAETRYGGKDVWWFENHGRKDGTNWIRHDLGRYGADAGGGAADFNRDGYPDYWASGNIWINNRNKGFNRFGGGPPPSHDGHIHPDIDINLDGIADVIWATAGRGRIQWFPGNGNGGFGSGITVDGDTGYHGSVVPRGCGDIDGDGDIDMAAGGAWYENRNGSGTQWKKHRDFRIGGMGEGNFPYGVCFKTWVADIDGDGDNDVIETEADTSAGQVAVFINNGNGTSWEFVEVENDSDGQDWHTLGVADFDGDGDNDIWSGSATVARNSNKIQCMWENVNGDGKTWKRHVVSNNSPGHDGKVGDIDGDGDLDVAIKPWNAGNVHFWLENTGKTVPSTPTLTGKIPGRLEAENYTN
jgi:hypothetical protein